MKVAVVGLGYAGLVTAVGFAAYGHEVYGLDVDAARVRALIDGDAPPFHEPGLADHLRLCRARMKFTTDPALAVTAAEVVILAVGTPTSADGESADLSQLRAAALAIMPHLALGAVVAVKSTVPPGTNAKLRGWFADRGRDNVLTASLPEFLREGTAVADVMRPDRVVIGTEDGYAAQVLTKLHQPMVREATQILVMKPASAELTKYASNAMLATRISFMNEIANLAEKVGADVTQVRRGVGMDGRIGPQYLHAGVGWGGSCFRKDLLALKHVARDHDVELWVADMAEAANRKQQHLFAEKVVDALRPNRTIQLADLPAGTFPLTGKKIAVWGLAFKPDTDDIRDAPAHAVISHLIDAGAEVCAHDPIAAGRFALALDTRSEDAGQRFAVAPSAYAAVEQADALVLLTEWREYRVPDWARLANTMRGRHLFDGRNVWDKEQAWLAGFTYAGVGR